MSPIILGIESSCDDSAAAIVDGSGILSNIVISQNKEHEIYQGVVPEIAARAHMQNLKKAITMAMEESCLKLEQVDAIAATCGPGLIGGVIVGAVMGKAMASALNKPFIAINHLEGHALTARLTDHVAYPYLLLLMSGGHCQFVVVQGLGRYKILGSTIDDSVGEAFDKVAKMLNLGFPGGQEIEKYAKFGDEMKYILPKPLLDQDNCNFSFSGLKTATKLLIESLKPLDFFKGLLDEQKVYDIAASFQYTVSQVLVKKLKKAIKLYEQYVDAGNRRLVISGGVAANQYLRSKLTLVAENLGYKLFAPPMKLCTDNAAMIAYAGLERFNAGLFSDLNFCPKSRWSLEELK